MSKTGKGKEPESSEVTEDSGVKEESEEVAEEGRNSGISKNKRYIYTLIGLAAILIAAWALGLLAPLGAGSGLTGQVTQLDTGHEVQAGDTVEVEYTGKYTSGEVFDSGVFDFVAGSDQVIKGFDDAVMGMRVGEEKTVTIPPEKAYGERDPSQVLLMPVFSVLEKKLGVTKEQFENEFQEQPEVGKRYETGDGAFPVEVTDIDGENVSLGWLVESDDNIADMWVPGAPWTLKKISENETAMVFERKVIDGMTVVTSMGPKEVSIINGQILIDMNHLLAGETLVFTIKLLDVTGLV